MLGDGTFSYFGERCLANRFLKQHVTVSMMSMPTNRAEDTPTTRGMRWRSAAGRGGRRRGEEGGEAREMGRKEG